MASLLIDSPPQMRYTVRMEDLPFLFWNHLPWFWLALTVIFIVIEGLTMTLTTIWFACGAFAMVFLSMLPIPGRWQLLIFALASLFLLVFTRPLVRKKLRPGRTATNSDSLIGRRTVVLGRITELEKGTVKLNGTVWSAKGAGGSPLDTGEECVIQSIEGNTLVVAGIQEGGAE